MGNLLMFTPITAEVGAERPESFFLFHFVLITGDKRIRKKSSTTVRSTVNLSQQTSNHQLSKQHVSLENFTPTLWAKVFPSWLRNEREKKFRSTNELHKSVASKLSPLPLQLLLSSWKLHNADCSSKRWMCRGAKEIMEIQLSLSMFAMVQTFVSRLLETFPSSASSTSSI